MKASRRRWFGDGHKYTLLGGYNGVSTLEADLWRRKHSVLLIMLIALAGLAFVFISGYYFTFDSDYSSRSANYECSTNGASGAGCDTVNHGFQCYTSISHFWGEWPIT